MSLQWVAVAGFLYVELALTLLLILPLLRPRIWKQIFGVQIFQAVQPVWSTVYYAVLFILAILFVDSIRTMFKYSEVPIDGTLTLDNKLDRLLRECKGQRNFYITGFALFLILVIRRLITMICELARLDACHEAAVKQATNANAELSRRMEKEGKKDNTVPAAKKEEKLAKDQNAKDIPSVDTLQKDLKKAHTDLEAMKKQAESTNREYDRLSEENQRLQNRVQELEGKSEPKKDQ